MQDGYYLLDVKNVTVNLLEGVLNILGPVLKMSFGENQLDKKEQISSKQKGNCCTASKN
jgi:hypothetical protein